MKQESKNAEIVNEPANEKGKKEVEQNIKKETSSTTKEAPATPKEEKTKKRLPELSAGVLIAGIMFCAGSVPKDI